MGKSALIVEDDGADAVRIRNELGRVLEGWTIVVAGTVAEARRRMASGWYDLYIIDYLLPDGDGLDLLREIRARQWPVPTLFVTRAASARIAVEAMKLGADEFIVKEEGYLAILPFAVGQVLDRRRLAEERRGIEERLQRAERTATLGYIASSLAHAINNPLSTIRTFLQLLPTNLEDEEFKTRYRAMALADVERIQGLVRDITFAAAIPPAGQEGHVFEEILVLAENAVAEELGAKGMRCRVSLPNHLPKVRVHREAAARLLLTLLENAVRFSPEGEEIEIEVGLDESAGRLVTIVRDRGPGVPAAHRDKIFEACFTTAVHGLGMGLFVASRIADLQNIELSLLNEPGGAAFRVGLPLA